MLGLAPIGPIATNSCGTTKNTMTFDFLIEQNKRTLAFLKTLHFTNAIESSSYALQYQKALDEAASSPQSSLGYNNGNDSVDQCMLLSEINDCAPHDADPSIFVYDHGIVIPPLSVTDPSVVTPILIFNTALAYHMAVEAGHITAHEASWQKARRLYELAYHSNDDMDSNVLFQCVLINNVAMIDRKMGNMATSTACLEYLLSVLMIVVDRGCNLHLQHVQGCLVNITMARMLHQRHNR